MRRFESNRPRRKRDPDGREYAYSPGLRQWVEVVPDSPEAAAKRHTKKKRQTQFVQVPRHWVEKLATSRSANAYRLGLYLLDEHFKNGNEPIRVSNIGALNGAALGRMAKWRALRELEALELIRIEQHHGRSPAVTLSGV